MQRYVQNGPKLSSSFVLHQTRDHVMRHRHDVNLVEHETFNVEDTSLNNPVLVPKNSLKQKRFK